MGIFCPGLGRLVVDLNIVWFMVLFAGLFTGIFVNSWHKWKESEGGTKKGEHNRYGGKHQFRPHQIIEEMKQKVTT